MSTTAQPVMAAHARPVAGPDEHTDRRLRVAGVTILAAAALGSVLGAAPAATDTPATDSSCRMDIVGGHWFSSGCVEEPATTTSR